MLEAHYCPKAGTHITTIELMMNTNWYERLYNIVGLFGANCKIRVALHVCFGTRTCKLQSSESPAAINQQLSVLSSVFTQS